MKARNLKPGMIIEFDDRMALVVSQTIPAATIPRPENNLYCEPGLVIISHFRDDRWMRTSDFTYAIFMLGEAVKVNEDIRIQWPDRFSKFLHHSERIEAGNAV